MKQQHKGSQLKKRKRVCFHPILSSSPHQKSEIPVPLNRLILRARKIFIFFKPPPSFLQSYPGPLSYNKISDFCNYFIEGERKIWTTNLGGS